MSLYTLRRLIHPWQRLPRRCHPCVLVPPQRPIFALVVFLAPPTTLLSLFPQRHPLPLPACPSGTNEQCYPTDPLLPPVCERSLRQVRKPLPPSSPPPTTSSSSAPSVVSQTPRHSQLRSTRLGSTKCLSTKYSHQYLPALAFLRRNKTAFRLPSIERTGREYSTPTAKYMTSCSGQEAAGWGEGGVGGGRASGAGGRPNPRLPTCTSTVH